MSAKKTKRVRDCYPDKACPDCAETIPARAVEGDACKNCGHVFYFEHEDDDPKPETDGKRIQEIRERIADLFASGMSDSFIAEGFSKEEYVAVIRSLMYENHDVETAKETGASQRTK